ncbi:MAG: hypothetical protein DRH08_03325 [Deltaproteobacteria bacterium]|nr:MAG: hypothetical protein DRH08_03325 [Deltaproteobacteria bacterium]
MAGKGGYQPPRRPAAVSNPGSGRRTDGGAGSKKQPIKVASGGAYGQRKAATAQQKGAPMASGGAKPPVGGGGPPRGASPQGGVAAPQDMFRPSEIPGGPISEEQAMSPTQILKENPQLALRTMYSMYPTPAIAALLRRMGTNG